MRVPSYRKHSSGQARVTIQGRDFLLGKYDSPESWAEYARLIAEYKASKGSQSFGLKPSQLKLANVLLDYLTFASSYYSASEYRQLKLAICPVAKLYGNTPADGFGALEFKAVREDWLSDSSRTRQYINRHMRRIKRIVPSSTERPMNLVCLSPGNRGTWPVANERIAIRSTGMRCGRSTAGVIEHSKQLSAPEPTPQGPGVAETKGAASHRQGPVAVAQPPACEAHPYKEYTLSSSLTNSLTTTDSGEPPPDGWEVVVRDLKSLNVTLARPGGRRSAGA